VRIVYFLLTVVLVLNGTQNHSVYAALPHETPENHSNPLRGNTTETADSSQNSITVSGLPFALYSEIFGWATGGFVAVRGLSQRNMSLYTGGLISTPTAPDTVFYSYGSFTCPFTPGCISHRIF